MKEKKKSKKVKKEVRFRHLAVIYFLFVFLVWKFAGTYRFKFRFHKELKKKGPFVILGNHTVPEDPILMSFLFPMWHNYYIASEQIFNLGLLSKLLVWAVNPIKKSKSMSDMSTIRKSKAVIDQGGSIGMFVEGNVTYAGQTTTIHPVIVKFIRLMKAPVIFYNTEGLYLSNPRWSLRRKKGKTTGYVKKIMQVDEYKDLSDAEFMAIIKENLYVDCYDNKVLGKQAYKGKQLALGLERLLFVDLKSGTPFATYSKDNLLLSTESDMQYQYDEYGYLTDLATSKAHRLDELEKKTYELYFAYLDNQDIEDQIFEEEIVLEYCYDKHKSKPIDAYVQLYLNRILIQKDDGDLTLGFDDIFSVAIQGKKKVLIYGPDDTYLITLDEKSSPLKYLVTYQYYLFGKKYPKKIASESLDEFGL